MMEENMVTDSHAEKRSETRTILDQYYSVEFLVKATSNIYQFKLRDISSSGLCILVNEDSAAVKNLKAGDTLDMKYNPPDGSGPPESLKTQIKHITKKDQESGKGQYIIGLSIIEKKIADR